MDNIVKLSKLFLKQSAQTVSAKQLISVFDQFLNSAIYDEKYSEDSLNRISAIFDELKELVQTEDSLESKILGEPGDIVFIPDVIKTWGVSIAEAHKELFRLAKERKIELRPESGMGRLSEEELALCPDGPMNTKLSWYRIVK